jgi:ribosomal protein S6
MKQYELTVVFIPSLSSEKLVNTVKSIEKAVKAVKGKVLETEDWGEKPFSYTIKKYNKGVYRHFVLELPADSASELKAKLKHFNEIIRSLIVVR